MQKGDEPRVKTPAEQFQDTYRAGLIAGLREAEKIAYRAAMRFDTHSAVLAIRARIAALETEEPK